MFMKWVDPNFGVVDKVTLIRQTHRFGDIEHLLIFAPEPSTPASMSDSNRALDSSSPNKYKTTEEGSTE